MATTTCCGSTRRRARVGYWDLDNGAISGWNSLGSAGPEWFPTRVGDFTNDGSEDILWQHGPSREVGFFDMLGGGNSGWVSFGIAPNGWSILDVGDYTRDGSEDLLWKNSGVANGEVGYWDLQNGAIAGWTSFGPLDNAWLTV
jgi:hypothetical protein